ncbi:quinone oxidoreductase family protein [Deinococcus koreensis]|uniref:Zinc-binding alcohol dehydrogenase n=1 Tax=Deinococcus koreensis TaxID=2054903 RepID=A0A2K3UVT4_9DEIO|nr:zinc-binding dehydrogenase [Deinococcus koreensis]PNY80630.1 zinc-binding alcohol dehydrogenase [Deinococcus koreensis]
MSHAIVVHQHGGPEVLTWQERPTPRPGPGQVRVRVEVTGVNHADLLARRGGYGPSGTLPLVPGLDAVGTVEALGAGVTSPAPGQRVACFTVGGSYATQVLAQADLCLPLPPGVPPEAAAALAQLSTACGVLTRAARLEAGESVLIHAAGGGVGHLAVQLARTLGAGLVLGVVGSGERAAFVRRLGADHVIERRREDFVSRTLELTGGRGVDVILDSVGGETAERGAGLLARFGRLVTFGHAGGVGGRIPTAPLHREHRAVVGYSGGTLRQHRPEQARAITQAALGHLERGELRVEIGARFALAEAAAAHHLAESGGALGKVLLEPG